MASPATPSSSIGPAPSPVPAAVPADVWRTHLSRQAARIAGTPTGLYVHVPFCLRRCGYCAFTTWAVGEVAGTDPLGAWVAAALDELETLAATTASTVPPLGTVYFGGGTPTLVGAEGIARILRHIRNLFPLAAPLEVSVEANPDTVNAEDFAALAATGVTRMSFGFQSSSTRVLELLDRTHSPRRALDAAHEAHDAGIAHVGLDLISGTPGELGSEGAASLDAALGTPADHISLYSLSIEPRTKLAARVRSGELGPPDPDVAADRYLDADRRLRAAGFEWYEVSNWARTPAARCEHNLLYWRNHNWLGVGPGAHSHLSGLRWWNSPSLDGSVPGGHEVVDGTGRELERLLLGVRLREGLPTDTLRAEAVAEVCANGWATQEDGHLVLTVHGRLLADSVVRVLAG